MENISLTINHKLLTAEKGQTILEIALANRIDIPHLCHDSRLTPTGACRLCIVEIDGKPGFHTACTLLADTGMAVHTETSALQARRRLLLELILSDHCISCPTCDTDGDCLLQDYAYRYRVLESKYPAFKTEAGANNYTLTSKALVYDVKKCIKCQRCVKICSEVQGVEALTLQGRARHVTVTTGFDIDLAASPCETCGQCISTCPTGALYERQAIGRGKAKEVNKITTTCPYCGVGCQVELNVHRERGEIVRITSSPGVIPNAGNLCVKGRFGMEFVAHPERLVLPLVKRDGVFRETSWEEALDYTAGRLLELKAKHGPGVLAGLSSAKTTNEDNYIMQKLVRVVFGTNNVDHCARLCHASTVAGLAKAFGSGAMTNSIEELGRAPVIFVIGSNTTECHPVIGILIRQAVRAGRTKLIVADPREISLSTISTVYMQQKPGTDVALINAMMHVIINEGLHNREFIQTHTEDFELLKEAAASMTPALAAGITGVPEQTIIRAARLYAGAQAASIVYSMGITQHTTGTDNVLSLANLAMLTGNVGKECAGVNPLRGQNNVQGACDMGALPNVYNGYQRVDDPVVQAKFEAAWDAALSAKPGLTVVEIIRGAAEGEIKGLYIMGENPMLSDPDIAHVEAGLKNLEFLVVQDIFLTETARLADVVFPSCSFAEKEGTFTNTERRVQRVRQACIPPGEARPDWKILCALGTCMGYKMDYCTSREIQEEIAALTPSYGGILYDRIETEGLQWPCPDINHPGTKYLHKGHFTRGKGKFHAVHFLSPREQPDELYPFILTTGRNLEHWHTGTMTRKCVVLNDLMPHGVLEIHPEDAAGLGLEPGIMVSVESRRGRIELPVKITPAIARGVVFLAFHFKEHPANALTIAALDPVAKIPEFKACAVRVQKTAVGS